jgi:hypothetical protein
MIKRHNKTDQLFIIKIKNRKNIRNQRKTNICKQHICKKISPSILTFFDVIHIDSCHQVIKIRDF